MLNVYVSVNPTHSVLVLRVKLLNQSLENIIWKKLMQLGQLDKGGAYLVAHDTCYWKQSNWILV